MVGGTRAFRPEKANPDRHRAGREQLRQHLEPAPDEFILGFGRDCDDHPGGPC